MIIKDIMELYFDYFKANLEIEWDLVPKKKILTYKGHMKQIKALHR